jgi:Pentapeptide repeats (8 copies)
MTVRLGAIYALERISKDSRRDYWTIMETLTAYVRENAPWPPRQALANPFVELQGSSAGERAGESTPAEKPENEAEQAGIQVRPATDIQAILTVLGRRDKKARKQDEAAKRHLDLTAVDLRGAHLPGAHLRGANLQKAHLERATLWEAGVTRRFVQNCTLTRVSARLDRLAASAAR